MPGREGAQRGLDLSRLAKLSRGSLIQQLHVMPTPPATRRVSGLLILDQREKCLLVHIKLSTVVSRARSVPQALR